MESNGRIVDKINWQVFLEKHDLIWNNLTYNQGYNYSIDEENRCTERYSKEWNVGAFTGNGIIGTMIYKDSPETLRLQLGRNDVVAHNFLENVDWATPRVPIGDLLLTTYGKPHQETMRLNLWDAEVTGVIETNEGKIQWRSITCAEDDLILIEVVTEGEEDKAMLSFRPQHGISPRLQYSKRNPSNKYLPPLPIQGVISDVNISIQTFLKEYKKEEFKVEGECAVAWKEVKVNKHYRILYCSIKNSMDAQAARNEAIAIIKQATQQSLETIVLSHRNWWHNYYPASFLSIPDKNWEKFYWIQMYKLACAISEKGVALDTQGPWLVETPWPTAVWNLNVQLSYMPVYSSNRIKLAESLIHTLEVGQETLRKNAESAGIADGMFLDRCTNMIDLTGPWPGLRELGNLTWTLHNVWRHYRSTMDDNFLRDRLFPLLRSSINLFLHLMYKGEDGKWHLPPTCSPEYPVDSETTNSAVDCNYSLALFKWGCETLVKIEERLNIKDPLSEKWRDVIINLVEFPTDMNGFMIGANIPFDRSHRHYSHLLMFYPLHIISAEDEKYRNIIEKSINHWIGLQGGLSGYSFTGAVAMSATMGKGNLALDYLNSFKEFLQVNTMYVELGPCIETPLSCAEAIHYMLIQSYGDIIRIFPALPDQWRDITFHKLLAEGAFEISAKRKNGVTEWIYIKSLEGSPCQLQHDLIGDIRLEGDRVYQYQVGKEGTYTIDLKKGEQVYLYSSNSNSEMIIEPTI